MIIIELIVIRVQFVVSNIRKQSSSIIFSENEGTILCLVLKVQVKQKQIDIGSNPVLYIGFSYVSFC